MFLLMFNYWYSTVYFHLYIFIVLSSSSLHPCMFIFIILYSFHYLLLFISLSGQIYMIIFIHSFTSSIYWFKIKVYIIQTFKWWTKEIAFHMLVTLMLICSLWYGKNNLFNFIRSSSSVHVYLHLFIFICLSSFVHLNLFIFICSSVHIEMFIVCLHLLIFIISSSYVTCSA